MRWYLAGDMICAGLDDASDPRWRRINSCWEVIQADCERGTRMGLDVELIFPISGRTPNPPMTITETASLGLSSG